MPQKEFSLLSSNATHSLVADVLYITIVLSTSLHSSPLVIVPTVFFEVYA